MPDVKDLPVLIVDDDPLLGQALGVYLQHKGYPYVHTVTTGADAMSFARDNRVLAAIVDIHLPDIHGLILSQQLRATCGPSMPILILSGDSTMGLLNSLPLAGATYYFRKPVEPAKLLQQLESLLTTMSNNQ
jgi:DNA-binding response OmpR family regulator